MLWPEALELLGSMCMPSLRMTAGSASLPSNIEPPVARTRQNYVLPTGFLKLQSHPLEIPLLVELYPVDSKVKPLGAVLAISRINQINL